MIVNLTKHDLNIYNENKELVLTVPPSGLEARIDTTSVKKSTFSNIPIFETKVNGDFYLIDKNGERHNKSLEHYKIYVVSGLVRQYVNHKNLYQPGQLLRNEKGQVIGCIGLSQ